MSAEVVTLVVGTLGILGTLFSGLFGVKFQADREDRRRKQDREREDALRIEERNKAARAEEIIRVERMLEAALKLQEEILPELKDIDEGVALDDETSLKFMARIFL